MRLLWPVVVALFACKGGGDDKPSPPTAPPVPAYPLVAKSDAVLPLAKVPVPSRVVWLNESGSLQVATPGKVWDGKLPTARASLASAEVLAKELEPLTEEMTREEDPWRGQRPSFIPATVAAELARGYERPQVAIGSRTADEPTVLVMPHSTTPATALAGVLEHLGGHVGVVGKGDALGALRLAFRPRSAARIDDEKRESWVELHLESAGIDIVSLPSNGQTTVPWVKHTVDEKELGAVVRGFGKELPGIDVLVTPEVPAQKLVDTLVSLDGLGVTVVGVGVSPGPAKDRVEAVKTARMSRASFHTATAATQIVRIVSHGDLEKPLIKEPVRAKLPELTACYDKVLATNPGVSGSVIAQFFITPHGKVASSSAQGLDPAVASCVADIIKQLEFTKPRGGGGAQVNVMFRFWPYEA
ncbi:MAG: AgmX/PglI C-terminal domain-containing protein [Deltaproteobacteria bacterium]|nr:AgmX/PglI C-terminal domain-containing protein [Deltaproteobacteria bacterium]